jgi:uracil-DNA glycosylase
MPVTVMSERSAELQSILADYQEQPMLRRLASQSVLVPPEGLVGSPVMLVGEAPGADEVRLGRPFAGRAGAVLDKALKKADIERKWSWITNVVLYRPEGNRTPYPFEIACSRNRLLDEIRLVRPSYVIALGATSWRALSPYALRDGAEYTEVRGISQLLLVPEGRHVFECRLLVTWHPAATFHSDVAGDEFESQIAGFMKP